MLKLFLLHRDSDPHNYVWDIFDLLVAAENEENARCYAMEKENRPDAKERWFAQATCREIGIAAPGVEPGIILESGSGE